MDPIELVVHVIGYCLVMAMLGFAAVMVVDAFKYFRSK